MVRIFTRVKTDCCGFLFGVFDIVFLINGHHFCLFQNTIFELNFGVLVRIFDNQRVTKNANRVLIRIKIHHHFCFKALIYNDLCIEKTRKARVFFRFKVSVWRIRRTTDHHKAAEILRFAFSGDTAFMLKIGRFFAFQVKKK